MAVTGLFAFMGAVTARRFWSFVPLGGVGLWLDHRRFLQRRDLAFLGARVHGGAPNERLLRP